MPKFRPSKFTAIAVGGAFCLAAAGSVSAATLSSSSSNDNSAAAAGLTSQTVQAQQAAAAQSLATAAKAAAAKAAAAKAAAAKDAQVHTAHVAHQQHAQLLAARAEAARVAAQRAAAAKAAAAKAAAAQKAAQQPAAPATASGSPQQIAQELLDQQGMGSQFSCLDSLWAHESGWSVTASNPSSGAYGIPQALPGSRMGSAGPDWQTNAETQIKWGLQYIDSTYGSPCAAESHEQSDGWY